MQKFLNKWLIYIIAVMLLLLLLFQIQLLRSMLFEKERLFEQNALLALREVSKKLEITEAIAKVKILVNDSSKSLSSWQMHSGNIPPVPTVAPPLPNDTSGKVFTMMYYNTNNESVIFDTAVTGSSFSNKNISVQDTSLDKQGASGFRYSFSDTTIQVTRFGNVVSPDDSSKKKALAENVIDMLFISEHTPLEKRIDKNILDSLLQSAFSKYDITTPFIYGVREKSSDSLKVYSSADTAGLASSPLRTSLFEADVLSPAGEILVHFPSGGMFLLLKTLPLFIPAVLVIIMLSAAFFFIMQTIKKQQRYHSLISSFISNMTHEFKTPIASVGLAAEALRSVYAENEKELRYISILQSENERMKMQVDKILQMAALESGLLSLQKEPLEINTLIKQAINAVKPLLEQKKGNITFIPSTTTSHILADKLHLTNIFVNLLENAIKYTDNFADIHIWIREEKTGVNVFLKDNGVGIAKEDLPHIFEKYYRANNGNIHSVKGFGLGLSYVRLIAEAHGGSVSVKSTVGAGSEFLLQLPLS